MAKPRKTKDPARRPPGRPRKYKEGDVHRLVFRVPNDLHERVERLANDADESINDVLVFAVQAWLRTDPKPTATRVREWLASMKRH